jgi:hypothetical protein
MKERNPFPDAFSSPLYMPPDIPVGTDDFGPLSQALGDPEAIEPRAYGSQKNPGGQGGLLQMLLMLLRQLGGGNGMGQAGLRQGSGRKKFADETTIPGTTFWGARYGDPATRSFGSERPDSR